MIGKIQNSNVTFGALVLSGDKKTFESLVELKNEGFLDTFTSECAKTHKKSNDENTTVTISAGALSAQDPFVLRATIEDPDGEKTKIYKNITGLHGVVKKLPAKAIKNFFDDLNSITNDTPKRVQKRTDEAIINQPITDLLNKYSQKNDA